MRPQPADGGRTVSRSETEPRFMLRHRFVWHMGKDGVVILYAFVLVVCLLAGSTIPFLLA